MNIRLATIAYGVVGVGALALAWGVLRQGKQLGRAAGDALQLVNPANPDNIVAQTVNGAVQAATGGRALSLGDFVYSLINKDDAGAIATAPSYPRGSPEWAAANASAYDVMSSDDAELGGFMTNFFPDSGFVTTTGGGATTDYSYLGRRYGKAR